MTRKLITQSLASAALVTIGGNILGRVFGFAREIVIADYFGTSAILDTFVLAFTLPEILAMILFTALPVALIPSISNTRSDDNSDARLFWSGLVWFALGFLGTSVLLILLRSHILSWLAPGLSAEQTALGSRLMLILSLYVFFRGLEAYFRSWCFAKKHFVAPATSTIIINSTVIASVFLLYDRIDIETLAWGWLVGSAILALYNGTFAFRAVKPTLGAGWSSPFLRVVLRSLIAVAAIETISMLFPVIDRVLAARYLDTGPISALRYANTLVSIPTGIFVAAFNIAAFPWISDLTVEGQAERLKTLYVQSVRLLIFFIGLVSAGVVIFAPDIVTVALQRGEFDDLSLTLTAGPLAFFALGMMFQAVYTFQMRFYYARKLLLRLGLVLFCMVTVKAVLSYLLVDTMDERGLALATAIVRVIGFVILTYDLARFIDVSPGTLLGSFVPRAMLSLALTVLAWLGLRQVWPSSPEIGHWLQLLRLLALAIVGIGLHLGLGYVLKLSEPQRAIDLVLRRNRG